MLRRISGASVTVGGLNLRGGETELFSMLNIYRTAAWLFLKRSLKWQVRHLTVSARFHVFGNTVTCGRFEIGTGAPLRRGFPFA